MDMPDRKPELQCESQQRKPRAETAWYRSNALDHSFRCSRPNLSPTPLPIGNHYRGAHQVALAKLHRGYDAVPTPPPNRVVARSAETGKDSNSVDDERFRRQPMSPPYEAASVRLLLAA